jgi:hypothetical protein
MKSLKFKSSSSKGLNYLEYCDLNLVIMLLSSALHAHGVIAIGTLRVEFRRHSPRLRNASGINTPVTGPGSKSFGGRVRARIGISRFAFATA